MLFRSGIVVAIASAFQQYGIIGTDAGPAGFITGLYVVFVPIFGLVVGVRTLRATWIGCALALGGMGARWVIVCSSTRGRAGRAVERGWKPLKLPSLAAKTASVLASSPLGPSHT